MTRLNLEQHNINVGRDVSREVGIPGVNTGSDLTSGLNEINITGFGNLGETSPSVIVSENWQVTRRPDEQTNRRCFEAANP
ncbi:MAG: hypothetical protein GEU99_14590, partial [Luteitalea sp.]|nr:hypothetical protein [Luteitalea sp.]